MSLSLVLQNRWEILKKLEGNDDEVEIVKFATTSSKQEEKKKSKKEEEKKKSVYRFRFETRIDRFNTFSDEVKSLVRRRRRIELINEIPVKCLIRKRRGEMRGRKDLINTMPDDVKSLIFSKVGAIEILLRLQYVCSSWWTLSKDPYLFRVIDARDVGSFSASKCSHCYGRWRVSYSRDCEHYTRWKHHWIRRAVDRSCGQLTELHIGACANDEILHYVLDKSTSLKCLVLNHCSDQVSNSGLIEAVRKVPLLEEFEFTYFWSFSKEAIEAIGQSCLNLHMFALNFDFANRRDSNWPWKRWRRCEGRYDVEALAIAENMPKLQHLTLLRNLLTNEGLQAILDGCPSLEYLDIRGCREGLSEQRKERPEQLTILNYDLDDDDCESSYPSFIGCRDDLHDPDLHDHIDKREWIDPSSSEEESDDEDILKFLLPKADTFYI